MSFQTVQCEADERRLSVNHTVNACDLRKMDRARLIPDRGPGMHSGCGEKISVLGAHSTRVAHARPRSRPQSAKAKTDSTYSRPRTHTPRAVVIPASTSAGSTHDTIKVSTVARPKADAPSATHTIFAVVVTPKKDTPSKEKKQEKSTRDAGAARSTHPPRAAEERYRAPLAQTLRLPNAAATTRPGHTTVETAGPKCSETTAARTSPSPGPNEEKIRPPYILAIRRPRPHFDQSRPRYCTSIDLFKRELTRESPAILLDNSSASLRQTEDIQMKLSAEFRTLFSRGKEAAMGSNWTNLPVGWGAGGVSEADIWKELVSNLETEPRMGQRDDHESLNNDAARDVAAIAGGPAEYKYRSMSLVG
ncbi:hypothetical protein B0H16DRAFT_1455062 [Mycena metata]|uniref:Uncharacterized protein n=1 Tax=Mycena metata TaxID=1033252 RepID=A0AAD7NK62_9AGAR|nr:hypothetical protein B0H16DRAFT_1455062 [Mycena metata]